MQEGVTKMKRKLPLLLVVFMLLSAVYAPVSYAAPSPERGGSEPDINKNVSLPELPAANIAPGITVDQNGAAAVRVDAEQLLGAVGAVLSGDAVKITIAATAASNPANDGTNAVAVSMVMPREALMAVAEQTDVELEIVTDIGQMILPHAAIASIAERAGGEDVTINMSQKTPDYGRDLLQEALGAAMDIPEDRIQGGSITEIDILSGDNSITSWDGGAVILELPIGAGGFEQGKGYRVIQISADRSETEHTGLCVEDDTDLHVEISITHLSTFVVLAGAVGEDVRPEPVPTMSPLAVVSDSGNSGNSGNGVMTCLWFAAAGLALVAVGAAGGVLFTRLQNRKMR